MQWQDNTHAHAGSQTRVTSMGGLYDTATLRALLLTMHFQNCTHLVKRHGRGVFILGILEKALEFNVWPYLHTVS